MSEWQPIETAPRDGTEVLLFIPKWNRKVHLGYFIDTEDFAHGKSIRKRQCWSIGTLMSFNSDDPEPTHWMPLPESPKS